MGLIKSIQTSISGQYNDSFKEVIKSGGFDSGEIIKKVSTENHVIQDKSRLFVEPGECAVMIDNGAIKDIVTEPGMYFMDTSAPTLFQTNIFEGLGSTFLESMKRVAYLGEAITEQFVLYINLAEQVNLGFGTSKPILYKDPTWGPIEISLHGTYAFKITNPVNLLVNVLGNRDSLRKENLEDTIRPYIIAGMSSEVSNSGLSFDELSTKQDTLGENVIKEVTEKLESLGLEITKIVISAFDVPDEIKNSMRERTAIKMKATSATDAEADIYTKLNKAEAMKDLANNPSSSGATIMGMNMGNMFSGEMKNNENNSKNEE